METLLAPRLTVSSSSWPWPPLPCLVFQNSNSESQLRCSLTATLLTKGARYTWQWLSRFVLLTHIHHQNPLVICVPPPQWFSDTVYLPFLYSFCKYPESGNIALGKPSCIEIHNVKHTVVIPTRSKVGRDPTGKVIGSKKAFLTTPSIPERRGMDIC